MANLYLAEGFRCKRAAITTRATVHMHKPTRYRHFKYWQLTSQSLQWLFPAASSTNVPFNLHKLHLTALKAEITLSNFKILPNPKNAERRNLNLYHQKHWNLVSSHKFCYNPLELWVFRYIENRVYFKFTSKSSEKVFQGNPFCWKTYAPNHDNN